MKKAVLFGVMAMFAIGAMSIQTAEAQNPVKKSKTEKVTERPKNQKSMKSSSTTSMSKKSSNYSETKSVKPKTTGIYSSKSKKEQGSKKAKRK